MRHVADRKTWRSFGWRANSQKLLLAVMIACLIFSASIVGSTTAAYGQPSAPAVTSPATGLVTGSSSIHLIGTSDLDTDIEVSVNGVPKTLAAVDLDGNWTKLVTLAQGSNSISVVSIDEFNDRSDAALLTVHYDNTDPVVGLVSPAWDFVRGNKPKPFFANPRVPTVFTVTDEHPGTTECTIDRSVKIQCESGALLPPLSDGRHSLSVRHTDLAGNRSPISGLLPGGGLAHFDVFANPPKTKANVSVIKSRKAQARTRFAAYFQFSADSPGATFKCRLTASAKFKTCRAGGKKLRPDRYTLSVYAVDQVGRRDRTPVTVKFKVPNLRR